MDPMGLKPWRVFLGFFLTLDEGSVVCHALLFSLGKTGRCLQPLKPTAFPGKMLVGRQAFPY